MVGQWADVAMTRQGSTLRLYVNGKAVATATTPTGLSDTSANIFAIGRKSSSATDFFNGSLDEIAIYIKALSAMQIQAHFQAGQPKATATPTPSAAAAAPLAQSAQKQIAPTFVPPNVTPENAPTQQANSTTQQGDLLHLSQTCSTNPAAYTIWQVTNTSTNNLVFTWKVDGTPLTGVSFVVGAKSGTPGSTIIAIRMSGLPLTMTVRIYVKGVLQDVKQGTPITCASASLLAPIQGAPTSTPVITIEAENRMVTRTGQWTLVHTPSASGGAYLYSSDNPGDALTLVFSGTTLRVVYVLHPALGTFAVEIDGKVQQIINSRAEALSSVRKFKSGD